MLQIEQALKTLSLFVQGTSPQRLQPQEMQQLILFAQSLTNKNDPKGAFVMDMLRKYASMVQGNQMPQTQPAGKLTDPQTQQLRAQIQAYRHLSKNQPVPPEVNAALNPSGSLREEVAAAAYDLQESHKVDTEENPMEQMYAHVRNSAKMSGQRLIVPSLMPVGLDPLTLAEERERQIKIRVNNRLQELEQWVPENVPQDQKLAAIIELKGLRLLEKQKALRAQMLQAYNVQTTLQTSVARHDYRRSKKPMMRDIKVTEKMERQQKLEREKKEKQKHYDYLTSITNWSKDMLAMRKGQVAKQMKLGRAVISWHANVEREEAKRQERMAKERIKALKADDEEAYMKLLDKQKDTRLTHLLEQTDQYLDTLSTLVQAQQDQIGQGEASASTFKPTDFGMQGDQDIDREDYYGTAHRIAEVITEQPDLLVGGQLKEYQIKGLQWMVSLYNNKLNGILADEMGLGKTIQSISLVAYLIEKKNQTGPFLIIVPLSTITNWSLEFDKWAPAIRKVVYKGTPNQRKDIQTEELKKGAFNVLLTTYEYIIKDKAALAKYKWVHTIIDEGHRMKNANSKLSVTLTNFYHTRYRLILTGTPLQNNLPELWALLNFVLPKVFNSVKTFDDWFNTPFANTGEKIELNEEEQLLIIKRLHKVLRPFLLRRLKKDVEKDLPDKTERVLKTNLSALQTKLYSQVRQSGAMLVSKNVGQKGGGVRSINNTIMQLRKICNHPFVFDEVEDAINPGRLTNELLYRTSGKFELLSRVLPKLFGTGHRVLMFFQMTNVMNIMEDFLRMLGYKYLRLDGSTKSDDRSALLKLFNAPDSEYQIFILSTRAGGLGLNLQSADTVVIFDSDWNPTQDLQAQDRAHRIGQTREVRVFRLISANSIEETILARANYKLELDGKIIQAGKFDNKSSNEERDQALRSLIFENNPEENNVEDVDDDDELNQILARSEEELEIFKSIDAERDAKLQQEWVARGKSGQFKRLLALDELPEIYLHDFVPVEVVDETDFGRGRRAKDEVIYNDGLTDDQWAMAVDQDQDVDQLVANRRARRARKKAEGLASSTDNESVAESQTSDAQPRKKLKMIVSGSEAED